MEFQLPPSQEGKMRIVQELVPGNRYSQYESGRDCSDRG